MNYLKTFVETLNHPFNQEHKLRTIMRIIFWKINQLFFHLPAIVEIEKDIKCICYPESSYGSMVVYSRWPEYQVIKGIVDSLSGRDVYIDVGANFGDTTLVAAAHTKGKIYAFEPSPSAYSNLLENIHLNNLSSRITPVPKALSDQAGTIDFVDTPRSEVSHLSHDHETANLKVSSTTLDRYTSTHKIKKIKLLKIDVEGAELLVLKGAKRLLSTRKIKHIHLELNHDCTQYGYSNSDTVKYLQGFGYTIKDLPSSINKRIVNVRATLK